MINKWLHLDELGGNPWVLPIWKAITKAVDARKYERPDRGLSELGIHITTRLNMLPRIIKRINKEWDNMRDLVSGCDEKYIFNKEKNGYAFSIDNNLKYNLIIDIDSFLFEINSCCELMKSFISKIYKHCAIDFRENKISQKIENVIINGGGDSNWFEILDKTRNFFMHEGTPYIAISMGGSNEPIDLIIMEENLKVFDDPSKFITLVELNKILKGFIKAMVIIQKHIINLYNTKNN